MSNDIKPARLRVADITDRAARVAAFTVDVQKKDGVAITNLSELADAAMQAALKEPMFEGVDPRAVKRISSAWTSAMMEYQKRTGDFPPADLLANAHKCAENLMLESAVEKHTGEGRAMFESVAADMSSSDGVLRLAQFVALILPASLGAATSDACTFVPCDRDEAKIYELLNVAGTEFGDFKVGDELHMQKAGKYSQLKRNYLFPPAAQPDGTKKVFTFNIKDVEGKEMPIRSGRTRLIVDRTSSTKPDQGDGNLYFSGYDKAGAALEASCKVNYEKGTVAVTFTTAPPVDTELAVQLEINIEKAPALIPVINQSMREYTLSPSQYVIASEHTVMSASDASREFGIQLQSVQFTAMRNWLSHEQDMTRLGIMAFFNKFKYDFDVALPEAQNYDSWVALIRHRINEMSTDMVNRTRKSGIRGGFAGGEAANFIKSLPPQFFQQDPDYVESPYVQFIGTLFGYIRIYEVPKAVCEQFVASGIEFSANEILFYGRGQGIGDAGLVVGDAVPAIPYIHETNPQLVNRTTMWGSALNEIHPRQGQNYFCKLTLTNSKVGSYNMLTGKQIEGEQKVEAPAEEPANK